MLARTEAPPRGPLRSPLVGITLLVLLTAVSCSKKTAPETTAPSGFVVVRNAGAGFAVAVPRGWQQVPLPGDLDEFDKKAGELTGRNPKLGPAVVQARQLLQQGGKLMAVSPDGTSIMNLTVDKADEKTLAEIGRVTTAALQEGGATNIAQEQTTSGAGPALKLTFRYPIEGPGGTMVEADEIQYFVLHEGKSFVITLINSPPDVAAAIAGSLRLR